MRKFLPLALIAALWVAASSGSTAVRADTAASVAYYECGSPDWLVIQNAAGMPFWARDSRGAVVAQGVVDTDRVAIPIHDAAPGPLAVSLAGQMHFVQLSDKEWLWE